MGVGRPQDILEAIARGIDLFDCVLPTRNGRNAMAFTDAGTLRLQESEICRGSSGRWKKVAPARLVAESRGYLRHLSMADEMLGAILLTAHNVTYYQRLMAGGPRGDPGDRFIGVQSEENSGMDGPNK